MTIAHIYNGELGFDVRSKLNALIDQVAAIPTGPGGSGDVVGPAGAIADHLAVFDGITGKLIKDGGQSLASLSFTSSQISDFAESTDDRVASLLVAGSNITLTYNDPANTLTIASTASGGITQLTGDVAAGPGSGSQAATLASILGAGGPIGSSTTTPVISWDAKGRLTTVSSATISGSGGGGTTILDGSGPPASGLGAVGNYYVDNDDNTMYGPKATPGSFGPNQSAFPPGMTPSHAGSGNFELGCEIKATAAGQITAVRYWRDGATAQVARTVNVWTTGGTLLSSGSVANDGGGSGWKQVTLTTPVPMAVNAVVIASVGMTGDWSQLAPVTYPVSNGGDIIAQNGAFGGGAGGFPNTPTGYNYFTDVVFQVALPTWPVAIDGDASNIVLPPPLAIGDPITSATAGSVLFAGAAGVLAQDNANFFFNDATNDLHINGTSSYYLGTYRALYRIPSVSGDSWFEGDAGNLGTTGIRNFGTGTGALGVVTTGGNNTAIGYHTLFSNTSGGDNLAFGTDALNACVTGNHNVAIGFGALRSNLGSDNLAIGADCVGALTSGGLNTAIGKDTFFALTTGSYNLGMGFQCGYGLVTGDSNVFLGTNTGFGLASGALNTFIGQGAGYLITSGNSNTLIGRWQGPSAAMSNVIALSDGNTVLKADYGYSNNGWTFVASFKAGAPTAGDLPSGSFSVIDDTSAGQTWLVFNKAGTIRKVQLV